MHLSPFLLLSLFSHSVMSHSVTPWSVAHQASLSMGFPRQEYWSGLVFPSPGDLPHPGIKPTSPAWQADSLPLSHLGIPFIIYYLRTHTHTHTHTHTYLSSLCIIFHLLTYCLPLFIISIISLPITCLSICLYIICVISSMYHCCRTQVHVPNSQ